jgi:hypothetical protein
VSTIAFLSIGMHGHVNPTLPVVAEPVRRGHAVTYHSSPAFREEIEATGATVYLYPGGDQPWWPSPDTRGGEPHMRGPVPSGYEADPPPGSCPASG